MNSDDRNNIQSAAKQESECQTTADTSVVVPLLVNEADVREEADKIWANTVRHLYKKGLPHIALRLKYDPPDGIEIVKNCILCGRQFAMVGVFVPSSQQLVGTPWEGQDPEFFFYGLCDRHTPSQENEAAVERYILGDLRKKR